MFQTFHWMQNTPQRTLQQALPHGRTRTHKRKAFFSLSTPNTVLWENCSMIRSPGNHNNIRIKPVTAHNQTLSPSDALLLTGGARVGLGAQIQRTNSNNTMHKLLMQKWAQAAAVELCLTAPNLSRRSQWHSSTATLTHLTYEILTAPRGPTLRKEGGNGHHTACPLQEANRGFSKVRQESCERTELCCGGMCWPAELSVCHCRGSAVVHVRAGAQLQLENVFIVETLPGFSFNFVPFLED